MSDTPRTDALVWKHQQELNAMRTSDDPIPLLRLAQEQAIESMKHARELERALTAANERVKELEDERERGVAALREAFGPELWKLGHPAYIVVHLREESAKAIHLWKKAEIERDALREKGAAMLRALLLAREFLPAQASLTKTPTAIAEATRAVDAALDTERKP